jgi:argininosuccinate synthase
VNGGKMTPLALVEELNRLGAENAIGRVDMVETRQVGMKSRGVYETPGGTILHAGIRELEQITLDADALHLKRMLAMRYAELVYSGKWFTPLRESLEAFMEKVSAYTSGVVRMVLYKGNIIVAGRRSPYSLYLQELASFGASSYDHGDATGFINLFGLATGVSAIVHRGIEQETGQAPEIKSLAGFHEK